MKVEKWVTVSIDGEEADTFRIDLHVSLEDIKNLMLGDGDSREALLEGINQAHRFMNGVPDEVIAQLNSKQRSVIAESLETQAARYRAVSVIGSSKEVLHECDRCGRKSAVKKKGELCGMGQPDDSNCNGTFI